MKYVQQHFLEGIFMCAPSFLVCAHLTASMRDSLEGTLVHRNRRKTHVHRWLKKNKDSVICIVH